MNILIDYMVGLGLEVGKDKLTDKKEQKEIRETLQSFIEMQAEINKLSIIAEEIDFQGLVDYINSNLLEDVKLRLFGKNEERKIARETIINKAVYYSQVKTESSRKKVVNLITGIIDILREYYRKKVGHHALLISAEIVDDLENTLKEQFVEQEQSFTNIVQLAEKRVIYEISNQIERTANDNVLSVEKNLQLTKLGEFNEIESNLNSLLRCIGSEHTLYPHYRYVSEIKDGKLRFISQPVSLEAVKKYPPKIECIGKIKLGTQYLNEFNSDIISYANRHQLPITIGILEAQKFLGDINDPIQYEAEELIGTKVVIPPKPFPDAIPYSIILDGNVEFEYILLRPQQILEDGTIILSNTEQEKCPFRICISINITEKKTNFNIRTENASNKDRLQYVRFMKKVSNGAKIAIRALSIGENLIEGNLNNFEYNSGFETVDEEITFLERVVSIEDYFEKSITLPSKIYSDDYEIICCIANLISGEGYHENWSEASFSFILNDSLKKKIIEIDKSHYSISYVGSAEISLYGEQYQFSIRRTYEKVQIKNLERLKKKVEVLDVGDSIKIEYLPEEENGIGSYVDILHTESF